VKGKVVTTGGTMTGAATTFSVKVIEGRSGGGTDLLSVAVTRICMPPVAVTSAAEGVPVNFPVVLSKLSHAGIAPTPGGTGTPASMRTSSNLRALPSASTKNELMSN
jgi:hypothetical protein